MVRTILAVMLLTIPISANAAMRTPLPDNSAKGEMILEVSASGTSKQKASKITSICYFTVEAETENDAKQLWEKNLATLQSSASGGISFDYVQLPEIINTESDDAATRAIEAVENAAAEAKGEPVTRRVVLPPSKKVEYKQRVIFSGPDGNSFVRAKQIIEQIACEEEYPFSRNPTLEIADAKAAKKLAIQSAITNAKVQAQEYADVMNMQIVRLARISDAEGIKAFLGEELSNDLLRDIRKGALGRAAIDSKSIDDIEIIHNISAEFILKPK
jgi:hypothetical protein